MPPSCATNYKACFECHKPHEEMDDVISLAAVRGAVVSTRARLPIITKGQSAALPFNTAGTCEYICGLHPQMKRSVEVK